MESLGLNHQSQSFILLLMLKIPTILHILTFMCRINFMLSWVEDEKKLYNLGGLSYLRLSRMNYLYLLKIQRMIPMFLYSVFYNKVYNMT